MQVIKLSIVLLIVLTSLSLAVSNSIIEIRNLTGLQKDEKLIVTFQEVGGNCIKCYSVPVALIESVKSRMDLKNVKIVAAVRCNRDIEINVFKKQYDWKYFIYPDKNKLRKELSVKPLSGLAVLDYTGNVLLELEAKKGVFGEDVDKLVAALK